LAALVQQTYNEVAVGSRAGGSAVDEVCGRGYYEKEREESK
jgi:hypothetical protein